MKLASLERIKSIAPIPGADRIQLATVLGWQTIIKRGEFVEGDMCVWHNPDTIVDETNPIYSFLESKRFRIKVVKFKGKFSQGLALPLYPLLGLDTPFPAFQTEGTDVSELIKIKKYEKELHACLASEIAGNFPTHLVSKTDEPLLRSHPAVTHELAKKKVRATLKLDGSSCTIGLVNGEFFVCSRNLKLKENEGNSFWRIARQYDLENKFRAGHDDVIVQGELCGPGVQKNPMGLPALDFYAFNVTFPNPERNYADGESAETFAKACGLKWVPLAWEGELPEADQIIPFLQEFVNGLKYPNGKPAEGIVVRPLIEERSNELAGRLSVKIINENYSD
jgi:RNA ligase (TIGR02306 family)